MFKRKFGLSVTYLKSQIIQTSKKRIMVRSEASLNDVDDDQISLSRLEDQNMKSDEFIVLMEFMISFFTSFLLLQHNFNIKGIQIFFDGIIFLKINKVPFLY